MRDGFGGCIIIDDILKSDDACSDVRREGCIDWYLNTLMSRTNSPTASATGTVKSSQTGHISAYSRPTQSQSMQRHPGTR